MKPVARNDELSRRHVALEITIVLALLVVLFLAMLFAFEPAMRLWDRLDPVPEVGE